MTETADAAGTESRIGYDLDDDPIPDGWRFLHNQFGDDGYFALWTDAPEGAMPYEHQTRWFKLRQYTEQRTVTAWTRVRAAGSLPVNEAQQ